MVNNTPLPVGSIKYKASKDRWLIKIKEHPTKYKRDNWEDCNRYFYKQYYGEIPKGYVVYNLDCDKSNWCKENLIAIPKSVACSIYNMSMNYGINIFKNKELFNACLEINYAEQMLKELFNVKKKIHRRNKTPLL